MVLVDPTQFNGLKSPTQFSKLQEEFTREVIKKYTYLRSRVSPSSSPLENVNGRISHAKQKEFC